MYTHMCVNSWVSVNTCASTHVHNLAVSISDVWFMCSRVICLGLHRWSLRNRFAFPHTLLSCASYIPPLIRASRWESLNSSTLNIFLLWCFERILGIWEGVWAIFPNSKRGTHWTWHPAQTFPGSLSWRSCFFWSIPCMLILPENVPKGNIWLWTLKKCIRWLDTALTKDTW